MADAPYKGLTIRFGADTSEFASRMNSLQKVIGQTQTRINSMAKALRGDPTNVEALTSKFRLLEQQAQNLYVQFKTVNRELKELGVGDIAQLAEKTTNAAQEWRVMDNRVKQVNQHLHDSYEEMKNLARQAGMSEQDIKKAFSKEYIERFVEKIKEAAGSESALSKETEKLYAHIKVLKENWQEAFNTRDEIGKKVEQFERLSMTAQELKAKMNALAKETVEVRQELIRLRTGGEELDRLDNDLKQLRQEGQEFTAQINAMNQALHKVDYKNPELAAQAIETMADRINNARAQMNNLNEQLSKMRQKTGVQSVQKSMSELSADTRKATEYAERLEKEYIQVHGRLISSREELANIKGHLRDENELTSELASKMKTLENEIRRAEQEEKKLSVNVREANNALASAKALEAQKKLQNEIKKTSAQVTTLTAKTKTLNTAALNALRDLATGMGATIAPAVMMVGMHVATAGEQIDGAFRDMKKTIDGTDEQFEALRKSAVEFSKTHPVSADTILEIESIAGQLGIVVDEVEEFAHVVSNLDIATNMQAEEIALDLGKMRNIFKELGWDTERFGDSLVRLGNNFPALESDIMNISTRFAGMSAIVGVLPDEVLAISTAATATGQKADAAGGSLQRTFGRIEGAVAGVSEGMRNLEDATEEDIEAFEEAKGKLKQYAEVAGMSEEEFAKLWKTHERGANGMTGTTEAFKKFVEGLKRIKDEGGSVDYTLQQLGITGVRDRQLLEGLTNTTDVLNDALIQSREAWGDAAAGIASGGDAAREAAQKSEGFSGTLKMMQNTAQAMGDAFAQKLVPLMQAFLDVMRWASERVENMSSVTATFITVLGGLFAASAPIARMFAQSSITTKAFAEALRAAGFESKALAVANGASLNNLTGFKGVLNSAKTAVTNFGTSAANTGSKVISAFGKGGLIAVGIAVTVGVIKTLVTEIQKYREEQNKLDIATNKLHDSLYASVGVSEAFAAGFKDLTASEVFPTLANDAQKLTDEIANMYSRWQEESDSMAVNVGMLRHWGEVVGDGIGIAEDSGLAAFNLKNAVKELNDTYGLGLDLVWLDGQAHVVDAEGNDLNREALEKLLEVKEHEIELNMYAERTRELKEKEIELTEQIKEAEIKLAKAIEDRDKKLADGNNAIGEEYRAIHEANKVIEDSTRELEENRRTQEHLAAQIDITTKATDDNGKHVYELSQQYPILANSLNDLGAGAFANFINDLENAGYHVEDLSQLSVSEIDAMVKAWSDGSSSWQNDVRISTERMQADIRKTDEKAKADFDEMKKQTIKHISEMTGVSESQIEALASNTDFTSERMLHDWEEAMRKMKESGTLETGEMTRHITSALKEAEAKAKTSGEWVALGFSEGIGRYESVALTKAYNLGLGAIQAINKGTASASPSKKAIQSGNWVGEGFAIGMEEEEKAVKAQATLLGALATGALAAQSAPSAAALSGRAAASFAGSSSTTNNTDNSQETTYITLNVDAHDLQGINTINEFVAMVDRAKDQYARK